MNNSYVTSYAKGQQTGSDRRTQERINASIKSMREMIDEFQPEEEVQHYGEINYTGKIFDGVSLSSKPTDSIIPVIGKCNNYAILVGYIDYSGTLVIDCSPTFTDDVYGTVTITTTDKYYTQGAVMPDDKDELISRKKINETIEIDGAVIKRSGTRERRVYKHYYRTQYPKIYCKSTYYNLNDYEEVKDFTNAEFMIDVKYQGRLL